MLTERLYYQDSHLREFQASVLSCSQEKNGWRIVLDKTAFYPEGGGQPGDTGYLSGVRVTDTKESGGEIAHLCSEALPVGSSVLGKLDWTRRFDYMQQHSGEHIVSGIVHRDYGYDNVGFHMGADMVTIDFSGLLTMEQLLRVEAEVNEAVWRNLPILTEWLSDETKKTAVYRSKKELTGEVRLVTVPGYDVCACCGTHVKTTGEIGLVKIFTCKKFHEGVRVEMLCGRKAYNYVNLILEQNHRNSVLLSAKPQQTAQSVQIALDTLEKLKFRVGCMERSVIAEREKQLCGAGDTVLFEDLSPDSQRSLTDRGMQVCGGICAVFCGSEEDGYRYTVGQVGGDLRSFGKELNAALNGRGGGKPEFLQGSVQASRAEIEAFFEKRRS